jgi:copper transport protein
MTRLSAVGVVLLMLTVSLLSVGRVDAHATLRSSEPPANSFLRVPPDRLVLTFTEPLARTSSAVRILNAAGLPVETGAVTFSNDNLTMITALERLSPGIYNVLWENVSTIDGHGLRGSFPFTILNADGSVPDVVNTVGHIGGSEDPVPLADAAAVRALSLLGLLLAAGGALVLLLWDRSAPQPPSGLARLVMLGGGVALVAALLNLAVIDREYAGLSLPEVIFQTRIGGYWMTRFGAALLILMSATFVADAPRRAGLGIIGSVGIYVWGFSATSHAAAGAGSGWATALDFVHGIAAVLWIGAVIGLAVTLRLVWKSEYYVRLLPRFSLLAAVMVFFVLTTGLLNSLIQLDTPSAFVDTRYGLTLLVKLGLILPLLLLAGYNAKWGKSRISRGGERRPVGLLATVGAEIILGLAVLSSAALLTQTTVSRSVIREPGASSYLAVQRAEDADVTLSVDPNRTGVNLYRVSIVDLAGSALDSDGARLTFRYLQDPAVGPATLSLVRASEPGEFVGQGPFLNLEGQWRVEVFVQRRDADDTTVFFDVRPAGPALMVQASSGTWSNPSPGLTWNEFGGLLILMTGLGFALFRGRFGSLGRWPATGANTATVLGFGVGVLLLFGVHGHDTAGDAPENPIFPDRDSIARGRALYQQNCIACHGATGVPPAGLDLKPYPLDLTVHVPKHSDGEVFGFIAAGVPGTAMAAWSEGEDALSNEDMWHLVNYLRTLRTVTE